MAGKEEPLVSARDVRPAVAVIDACYAGRTPLETPWFDAYERLSYV